MRRGYGLLILLLLTSLACGFVNTATPSLVPATSATAQLSTQAPQSSATPAPAGTQAPGSTAAATSTPVTPTKTPYPTSQLDAQMSQEVALIQSQVVKERGLQPKNQVPFVLLTTAELRKNMIADYRNANSGTDISDSVLELSVMGLLQPNFDFLTFYTNLLSEQVDGYYDNETREMFVVSDQGFKGYEHLTYAHEFTHVLQDQNFDIENGLKQNDQTAKTDSERYEATRALLEGDATLSEILWYQGYSTKQDQQQIKDTVNSRKNPVYESAPAYLKEDFQFYYTQGLNFVEAIYGQGGWAAVDAVYHNPPVSTEQILHPELYPGDTPIKVDLPELTQTLGSGWRESSKGQVGEWDTYLILARGVNTNAQLDDSTAQAAAAGWGGDMYRVLHNDSTNQTALVMKTVWDSANDAAEFATAMQKYGNARFGSSASQQGDTLTWSYSGGFSSFYHSGTTTLWIVAPDATTDQLITGVVLP